MSPPAIAWALIVEVFAADSHTTIPIRSGTIDSSSIHVADERDSGRTVGSVSIDELCRFGSGAFGGVDAGEHVTVFHRGSTAALELRAGAVVLETPNIKPLWGDTLYVGRRAPRLAVQANFRVGFGMTSLLGIPQNPHLPIVDSHGELSFSYRMTVSSVPEVHLEGDLALFDQRFAGCDFGSASRAAIVDAISKDSRRTRLAEVAFLHTWAHLDDLRRFLLAGVDHHPPRPPPDMPRPDLECVLRANCEPYVRWLFPDNPP